MIDKEKIITGFKQFIQKAASFPISAQLSLDPSVYHSQCFHFTDQNNLLKISPALDDHDIRKIDVYRLHFPQSRILFTEFQHERFNVQWLEYFKIHVLLIEVFGNKPLTIETELPEGQSVQSLFHRISNENKSIRIEIAGQDLVIIQPVQNDLSLENLLSGLDFWLEREHSFHPLRNLTCPHAETIKQIDDLWARIAAPDMVESSGNEPFFPEHPMDFFWLQELYIRSARISEWNKTYLSETDGLLGLEQQHVLHLAAKRRDALGKPGNDPGLSDRVKIPKFLRLLIISNPLDEDALNEIQNWWDRISQPFLSLWLKKEIELNADNYIAFILLARENDFWWAGHAYHLILKLLPESTRQIIQLIWLIQSIITYHPLRDTFTFTVDGTLSSIQQIIYPDSGWDVKFNRKQDKEFLEVKGNEEFTFRINKNVRLSIDSGNKVLIIMPRLLRPPVKSLSLPRVKIEIDGYTLQIPLVWGQFYVVFNENRIKFLRKKKRFQLSFKVRKDFPALRMNNRDIGYSARYFKEYLPVRHEGDDHILQLCTPKGNTLRWFSGSKDKFVVAGYAVDNHGLIQTGYNLSDGKYSKSKIIRTNVEHSLIACPSENKRYRLKARYCQPIELEVKPSSAFISRFINTDGMQLVRRLRVYPSESAKRDMVSIRQKFYQYLGFYPDISSELGRFESKEFPIIIFSKKDAIPYTLNSDFTEFKLVQINAHSNQQAILIIEDDMDKFLSNGFSGTFK